MRFYGAAPRAAAAQRQVGTMGYGTEHRSVRREDALVLAHYYAPAAVQAAADFVGDSFALARKATESEKPVIVFCGVSFMGESAKILCPEKTVYLPAPDAHCPMADMADADEIARIRATPPYTLKHFLEDPLWVKTEQKKYKQLLKQYRAERDYYLSEIEKLTGTGRP